jgi:hypothetical protein
MTISSIDLIQGALRASAAGISLGSSFNPIAALTGAGIAAGLAGYRDAPRHRAALAAVVVLAAWAIGDGLRIAPHAQRLDAGGAGPLASAAAPWMQWEVLVLWGVAALLIGYAAPALLGVYVGRQVVRGTGWLSAIFIAVTLAYGLTSVAAPIGPALASLARL